MLSECSLYNIIHLELQPGTAVSENELSTTLSLSRTPVREALIELNRIGLVENPATARQLYFQN